MTEIRAKLNECKNPIEQGKYLTQLRNDGMRGQDIAKQLTLPEASYTHGLTGETLLDPGVTAKWIMNRIVLAKHLPSPLRPLVEENRLSVEEAIAFLRVMQLYPEKLIQASLQITKEQAEEEARQEAEYLDDDGWPSENRNPKYED
jgi:hypothetical protein